MYGLQTLKKLNEEEIQRQAEQPKTDEGAPVPRKTPLLELAPRLATTILDAASSVAAAFPDNVDPSDSTQRSKRVSNLRQAASTLETAAHWARVIADRIEYSTASDSRS